MPNCAVYGCRSHNKMKGRPSVKYYKFPKDENLAKQWSNAVGREGKINMKNAVICSKHFESKCFFTPLKYKLIKENLPKSFRNLIDTAVPTLFMPEMTTTSRNILNGTCTKRTQKSDLEKQKTRIDDIVTDQNDNNTNCYNLSESQDQLGTEPIGEES